MSRVPELLVLRLLCERAMHVEQLARTVTAVSGHTLEADHPGPQPVLDTLAARGLVRTGQRSAARPHRIYYGITPAGRRYFRELTNTWRRMAPGIYPAPAG
jgi:PadR family transcriptional regulator PadR